MSVLSNGLSKRLLMNVSLVLPGASVADIGCDHGYASIWLVERGIAGRAIALDVNEGPIERAREHVRLAGLEERISCRRSDGTEKLSPGEADTLMITGMGGPLTVRILREGSAVLQQVDALVLQPQSELFEVRRYVMEQGFEITEERACLDAGKYYFAMRAERRGDGVRLRWDEEWQYRYGTYLVREGDPVLRQYLMREREKYEGIIAFLPPGERQDERKCELRHRINEINQCLLSFRGED